MIRTEYLWDLVLNTDDVIHVSQGFPGAPCSFPIPIMVHGQLRFLLFFAQIEASRTRDYVEYYPPSSIAEADWEGGEFLFFKDKPPTFFGMKDDKDLPFIMKDDEINSFYSKLKISEYERKNKYKTVFQLLILFYPVISIIQSLMKMLSHNIDVR